MVQQISIMLFVSLHCSLKCALLFGRFHKAKLWYVSFLAPFLQANYDSRRFRLPSLTPPDFWSPPFLHLTLGFINEPAQESSVSLLFLCPAVLHGWEKQAWLIKDCLLYLLVISLIKKVLLLDGCCISLEKKKNSVSLFISLMNLFVVHINGFKNQPPSFHCLGSQSTNTLRHGNSENRIWNRISMLGPGF